MSDNDDIPFNRDFPLEPGVADQVRPGVRRILCNNPSPFTFTGTVSYISPFGAEDTQTMLARVELPNPKGHWRPGLFVTGEIVVEEAEVPVAVKASALQTFRDWDVVFMADGSMFEIAILELGRRDGEWAEVVSGLSGGQKYAAENSFIIKADILKSGASHDH